MTIEILYFADCPNYSPAVQCVRQALQQEHVSAEIHEVEVKDEAMALAVGFPGSPTIRIDGVDVEPAASQPAMAGMCCRTYTVGKSLHGMPSTAIIREAIRQRK